MHLFLQVNGFQGILQTSGFLAPGKKFGQLEVYNEENYLGPWDIASSSEVELERVKRVMKTMIFSS